MFESTDRSTAALWVFWVLAVVNVVCIVLRVWSRYITLGSRFGWDDGFAIVALPFTLAVSIVNIVWVHHGLGQHIDLLTTEDIVLALKFDYVGVILFGSAVTLPKFSVLCFYDRVFTNSNKHFRIVLWVLGLINLLWVVSFNCVAIFDCTPVAKNFDPALPGTCLSTFEWYTAFSVVSVVLDVGILIAPLPLIYALRMRTRRKVMVFSVFIAGYSVVALAIARLVFISVAYGDIEKDLTYGFVPLAAIAAAECTASIFGACLPTMFHLFAQIYRGGLSSIFYKPHFGRDLKRQQSQELSGMSSDRSKERGRYRSFNDETDEESTRKGASAVTRQVSDDELLIESSRLDQWRHATKPGIDEAQVSVVSRNDSGDEDL